MSRIQEDSVPALAEPLNRDFSSFSMAEPQSAGAMVPYGGAPLITAGPRQVTAQRVAVPRDLGRIMARIRQNCGAFGDLYVYSWQVNNRRTGTKDTIEGGTIKLANMLLQVFGNCSIDVDVTTTDRHQVFKAWFVDLETGFVSGRLYQQNLNPNIGNGMEAERRADMVFQIGQSKAIRNVVLNALGDFAAFAVEESKKALLAKFSTDEARQKAWAFIDAVLAENEIQPGRAAAVIGRSLREATIPNLALLYMKCRGIKDGLTNVEDEFPSVEDAEIIKEDAEAAQDDRRAAPRTRNPSGRGSRKKDEKDDAGSGEAGAGAGGAGGGSVPAKSDGGGGVSSGDVQRAGTGNAAGTAAGGNGGAVAGGADVGASPNTRGAVESRREGTAGGVRSDVSAGKPDDAAEDDDAARDGDDADHGTGNDDADRDGDGGSQADDDDAPAAGGFFSDDA